MNVSTAIVGDIGGHPEALEGVLTALSADRHGHLPPTVRVIQVGDLIRLRPDFITRNARVVEIALKIIEANPDRWTQLVGNHECAALGGPRPANWNVGSSLDRATERALQGLWVEGRLSLATVAHPSSGDVVITHAGLSQSRWDSMGRPTADEAAAFINSDVGRPFTDFVTPGVLVTGRVTPMADSLWAEVNTELLVPWLSTANPPFSQVHGHASPFHWNSDAWWPETPPIVRNHTHVDRTLRRSVTMLGSSAMTITSVDWTLEDVPPERIWPLLTIEEKHDLER